MKPFAPLFTRSSAGIPAASASLFPNLLQKVSRMLCVAVLVAASPLKAEDPEPQLPSFCTYDEATNTVTVTRDSGEKITYNPTPISVTDDPSRHLFTALTVEERQVYRMYVYAWEHKEADAGKNKPYYYRAPVTKDSFMNGYNAFINDYTEAWNLSLTPVTLEENIDGVVYVIGAEVSISMWDYPENLEKFKAAVAEWRTWYEARTANMVRRDDKIRALFDLVYSKVTYDDSPGGGYGTGAATSLHTAYGPLVNKKSVCEGYAKAFGHLAREFGLTDYVATLCGKGWDWRVSRNVSHCWNAIKLSDGKWYEVDPTWNEYTTNFRDYYHELYGVSKAWWEAAIAETPTPDPDEPVNPGIEYSVQVTVSGGGTVVGNGNYVSGSTVTVTATPLAGYTFAGWSGSLTSADPVLTFTITQNMTLTATFAPVQTPDPGTGGEGEDPGTDPEEPYTGSLYVYGAGKDTAKYDADKPSDAYSELCWAYAFGGMMAWFQDLYSTKNLKGSLPSTYPRTTEAIVDVLKSQYNNTSGSFRKGVEGYIQEKGYMAPPYTMASDWWPHIPQAYKSVHYSDTDPRLSTLEGLSALLLDNLYKGPAFVDLLLPTQNTGHAVTIWGADFTDHAVTAIYISDSDDKTHAYKRYELKVENKRILLDGHWAPRVNGLTFLWAPDGVEIPEFGSGTTDPEPDPGTGGGGDGEDPGTGGEGEDPGTGGEGENPEPEEPVDPSLPSTGWKPAIDVTKSIYTNLDEARLAAIATNRHLFILSGKSSCPHAQNAQTYLNNLGTDFSSKFVLYYAEVYSNAVMAGASPQYGTFDPRIINPQAGWTSASNYYDQGTGYSPGAINACINKANEHTPATMTAATIYGPEQTFPGVKTAYKCVATFDDGRTMVLPESYLAWGAAGGTILNGVFTSSESAGGTAMVVARFPAALKTAAVTSEVVSRTINIVDASTVVSIAIAGETTLDLANSTNISLSCEAIFANGTTGEIPVTWSVAVKEELAPPAGVDKRLTPTPSIDSVGRLTYSTLKICDHTLTVTATLGEKTDTKTFTVYAPARAWPTKVTALTPTDGMLWPQDVIQLRVDEVAVLTGGQLTTTTDVDAFDFWIKLDADTGSGTSPVFVEKATTSRDGNIISATFPNNPYRELKTLFTIYCCQSGSPQGDDTNATVNSLLSAKYTIAANNGSPRPEPENPDPEPEETVVTLRNGHELRVPHSWVRTHFPNCTDFAGKLEGDSDKDGFSDAEEYFIGTDPKDGTHHLKIEAIGFENGKPRFTVTPEEAGASAKFTIYGSATLNGTWKAHTDADTAHRFFRVRAEVKE